MKRNKMLATSRRIEPQARLRQQTSKPIRRPSKISSKKSPDFSKIGTKRAPFGPVYRGVIFFQRSAYVSPLLKSEISNFKSSTFVSPVRTRWEPPTSAGGAGLQSSENTPAPHMGFSPGTSRPPPRRCLKASEHQLHRQAATVVSPGFIPWQTQTWCAKYAIAFAPCSTRHENGTRIGGMKIQ